MSPLVMCLLLVLGVELATTRDTDYCYADEREPYLFFASKTAYEFIHKAKPGPENLPHCEPVQIWMLCRHGTRFPGLSTIVKMKDLGTMRDQIIRNHEAGTGDGRLCNKDLDTLKAWKFNVTEMDDSTLTTQGEEDMKFLALRLKQKFPTLLNDPYKSDRYQFRYTNTQRTRASAEKFAEGLFGSSSGVFFPEPLEYDPLIRDYSNCSAWDVTVNNNSNAFIESTMFLEGPLVENLLKNVSRRLGYRHVLKFKDVDTMYDMCRYDKAWNLGQQSAWCAAFSKEELKILEYSEDIRYYYKNGYGHDMNVKLGCPPVKDFMDHFSLLEKENLPRGDNPSGIFYFSHSTMLHMVQARMGVFKDKQPLLHSNYDTMQRRLWKISQTGPFSTNIAAVFFKCSEGEKNRVMFYSSESPLEVEGCRVGLCSWNDVKEKFSTISEQCNLDFCDMNRNGNTRMASTCWIIFVFTIILSCRNLFH